jgi:hypothetical protein
MPWRRITPYGAQRSGRRVLIDTRSGAAASGASPSQQTTLLRALQVLETFGWRGGDDAAGVCYVLPDLNANPQRPARRAAFFSLPNLAQIDAREARLAELAEPQTPPPTTWRQLLTELGPPSDDVMTAWDTLMRELETSKRSGGNEPPPEGRP